MSIKPEYFEYLNHFGNTVPVRTLFEQPDRQNIVALRHDVDHDLDLALEMSYWENRNGFRSTYYILHESDYWTDSNLLQRCLQIQDFGHEIGLHINVLSLWIEGKIKDPYKKLLSITDMFRNAKIELSGMSAHGDKLCYEHNFINYWLFSELKPQNPQKDESGLSAEGIIEANYEFQIQYPDNHCLSRPDGNTFELWSCSMKKLGIDYNASHLSYDHYFSDSWGQWTPSQDPLTIDMKKDRIQVLMHPSHWRGPKKIYFFLSTARSGSKWLSNLLDQATPLTAKHEFSLNHRFTDNALKQEKNTTDGFSKFVKNKKNALKLLQESRNWIENLAGDYAEANVYLEQFLPELIKIFPDAVFVFLHRNPKDIIRSIINRDWYDTPEDTKHPIVNIKKWNKLTQFEKACWYVSETHKTLLEFCNTRISFEKMTSDQAYLKEKLFSLDIPFFPRLALESFDQKINSNYNYSFPAFEQWTEPQKSAFRIIYDSAASKQKYETLDISAVSHHEKKARPLIKNPWLNFLKKARTDKVINKSSVILNFPDKNRIAKSTFNYSCSISKTSEGIEIVPNHGKKAYILLNGGSWNKLKWFKGWKNILGMYYRGSVELEIGKGYSAQIFCLMYDQKRTLLFKRRIGGTRKQTALIPFSFSLRGDAKKFNIALYFSGPELTEKIIMKQFFLECIPLNRI